MATSSKVDSKIVEQFVAITGATEDVAVNLLEACAGDLNMAVGMHMDNGAGASHSGDGDHANLSDEDGVRAPIPPKIERLVEDDYDLYADAYLLRKARQQKSVFDGFRDFQAESYQLSNPAVKGTKQSKKRSLEDLYRPPVDITFKGTFQRSRDAGTAQNKWLLVNIQNVQEFACQLLNRDVWSCTEARDIIKENFIFWQVYHDSEEGQRFMSFYQFSKWPYVAVIDPFTGEKQIVWNKISDGYVFCELVNDFLTMSPAPDDSLAQPPAKRQRVGEDSPSIENSLIDMLGSRESEVGTPEVYTLDDSPSNSQMSVPEKEVASGLGSQSSSIPSSPGSSHSVTCWMDYWGHPSDPMSSIIIRFPNNTRETIKLPCTSQLKALSTYCTSKGFPSEKYELVTNYPRRRLSSMSSSTILLDAGLHPQETIFVQDV